MEEKAMRMLILYATQTGNSLDAAERIAREAERRSCSAVTLRSIDDFDPSLLPTERIVLFAVSTTGQGDAPDSFKVFWKFLLQKNLGEQWLDGVHYAAFGLGDSSYQKYNFVAKKLDRRLSDLGATPLIEKGLGDDQHPSGYEGALDPWMSSMWHVLHDLHPELLPKGPNVLIQDTRLIDKPKVQIRYHEAHQADSKLYNASELNSNGLQIERALSIVPGNFSHDNSTPDCFLKLIKNQPLCRADSEKDVRHLEFEFASNIIRYEVGDVLEVLPRQNSNSVDAFIERCNLNPEALISVHHNAIGNAGSDSPDVPIKLKTFVELTMDVASASPRRFFFEVMSFFATAQHEKERLEYFALPEGRDDLYQYNQKERRTVLEVLEDFPSVQMPLEWLVQLVPPLKKRAFSISSSPSAHPGQAHLTVNVVSWKTPFKRNRTGLCSTWLASLEPEQGLHIPAWLKKGSLPPPSPSLPLILVGPGTGCAPFRGFLEERAIQDKSVMAAPILFFFGCRNEDNDFLYKKFWLSHTHEKGLLSQKRGGGFYTAFSRNQPQKVYVQHKMREHSQEIWDLLSKGAAIYIAGSSTKMPADVMAAFEEIISKEAGVSRESAVVFIRKLERVGRYHVEAWS